MFSDSVWRFSRNRQEFHEMNNRKGQFYNLIVCSNRHQTIKRQMNWIILWSISVVRSSSQQPQVVYPKWDLIEKLIHISVENITQHERFGTSLRCFQSSPNRIKWKISNSLQRNTKYLFRFVCAWYFKTWTLSAMFQIANSIWRALNLHWVKPKHGFAWHSTSSIFSQRSVLFDFSLLPLLLLLLLILLLFSVHFFVSSLRRILCLEQF